jgi:two-component system OmpR family response regulator
VSDAEPDDYVLGALREAGHVVEVAADPADGSLMAAEEVYEAILLDWRRPPEDWIRRFAVSRALLVVLAAAGDGRERARALRAGADACFVRPVAFAELEARLQALRRTARRHGGRCPDPPEIRLVAAERAVRSKDAQAILSALEFRMLEQLLARPGEVIGVRVLRRLVWGDEAEPASEPVHRCAARLRRKLASISTSDSIEAIPGHGYVFRHRSPARAQI